MRLGHGMGSRNEVVQASGVQKATSRSSFFHSDPTNKKFVRWSSDGPDASTSPTVYA